MRATRPTQFILLDFNIVIKFGGEQILEVSITQFPFSYFSWKLSVYVGPLMRQTNILDHVKQK